MSAINTEVYTVQDIMVKLDISKNVAYDLIKQSLFPVIKIKSTYRIPKKSFDEWLNKTH
ncbi:MAG: helix-turn-helix domain-containing protein [Clostridia bacterium]|nr:helix-turn-helix domain-containing protein [Clostridia bacterium]